ncbi:MAG: zinc ABC transporter solute-binding protein [Crenarchaeota archaeon]|nr:zinc ABC transporter solute-binding protein [Thermoproteota archaeon]
MLLFITILLLTIAHAYVINVTVTVPIEEYALHEAFPDILHIDVLLSGETNPHYIPLRPSMIKIVERSDIYVPLWHFPIEYRLAQMIRNRILIVDLRDYEKNGLKILYFPGSNIPDTHGWWLDPENMLALVKSFEDILKKKYPQLSKTAYNDLIIFKDRIHELENYLHMIGKEIRRQCPDVVIVCANPATLYLVHDLGLSCIVIRQGENIKIMKIISNNRPLIILLADFQKGTKLDWFYRQLLRRHIGTILYISILGSVNVNITYTGLLYSISGELYGTCISLTREARSSRSSSAFNTDLIYVVYVLLVLLSICIIVLVSMFRRVYRF